MCSVAFQISKRLPTSEKSSAVLHSAKEACPDVTVTALSVASHYAVVSPVAVGAVHQSIIAVAPLVGHASQVGVTLL